MRFPMTLGGFTKVTTFFSLLIIFVMLPFQFFFLLSHVPVPQLKFVVAGVLALVGGVLLVAVALAPRAVRVDSRRLVVERLLWTDFEVPLRQLTAVQPGPEITVMSGQVRRVAGNGGLMGFSGLFHVANVGLVRCWATRLGVATVLVRRGDERPLLLGVDDPEGLLQALHRATRL